jgi:methanogenic corrinoid protein MtbC1
MKKTIEAIRAEGLDKGRLILIGGGPVDDKTVEYVGADARCETAQETVIRAKKFLGVC